MTIFIHTFLEPYVVGFLLVAFISRWKTLLLVTLPLLACLLYIIAVELDRGGTYGALAILPLAAIWLGIFSGSLGRSIALAGRFESTKAILATSFFAVAGLALMLWLGTT